MTGNDAPRRRLVRYGGQFTSDELRRGEVELELPPPGPEPPAEEQAEPWALPEDSAEPKHRGLRGRLRAYRDAHREKG
jgi:hypothetical protein